MTTNTILPSYLFLTTIILTIARSLPTTPTSYIPINQSLALQCELPTPVVDADDFLVWEYAKTQAEMKAGLSFIIAIKGGIDLSRGSVKHLASQISENPENDDLTITPSDLSVGGIYWCRTWKSKDKISIYNVQVVSKPVVSLEKSSNVDEDYVVAGKSAQFTCIAGQAEPAPTIVWYLNDVDVSESEVSSTTASNDVTGLKTITSTVSVQASGRDFNTIKCEATSPAYESSAVEETYPVQYAPGEPTITDYRIIAMSEETQMTVCDNVDAKPDPDVEWFFGDEGLNNYTVTMYDRLAFNEALPMTYNNTKITCVVRNLHGETRTAVNIVVVDAVASESSTNIGSNAVLMIGVIVAAIVLAILGGVVTWKRCSHRADYNTREDQKQSGPDGINYEQDPEVEALAPGEAQVQKELLM